MPQTPPLIIVHQHAVPFYVVLHFQVCFTIVTSPCTGGSYYYRCLSHLSKHICSDAFLLHSPNSHTAKCMHQFITSEEVMMVGDARGRNLSFKCKINNCDQRVSLMPSKIISIYPTGYFLIMSMTKIYHLVHAAKVCLFIGIRSCQKDDYDITKHILDAIVHKPFNISLTTIQSWTR